MKTVTLQGLGIRSAEVQVLRQHLTALAYLLASEQGALPTRQHPVLERVMLGYQTGDPVGELDMRMECDPQVLEVLAGRVRRTAVRLHSGAALTPTEINDLGASLVLIRLYLSWRLGLLGSSGIEATLSKVKGEQTPEALRDANAWLWAGLVLARITDEAEEDDLDFGL